MCYTSPGIVDLLAPPWDSLKPSLSYSIFSALSDKKKKPFHRISMDKRVKSAVFRNNSENHHFRVEFFICLSPMYLKLKIMLLNSFYMLFCIQNLFMFLFGSYKRPYWIKFKMAAIISHFCLNRHLCSWKYMVKLFDSLKPYLYQSFFMLFPMK